jgi:hypothetical protein
MSSLEDFEDEDYAYVRGLFEGWTPDPMPSPNWLGIVQENSALDPTPTPTGKMESPTVYAAWTIDIDETEGDFAGLQAPCRWGRLTVACFTEPGARKGSLRKLRKALRRLLDAENEGALDFDVQSAKVQRVGEVAGGWYVENFVCPVIGG